MTQLLQDLAPYELSAAGFFVLMERWAVLRSSIRSFVSTFDVVLCPVAAGPAPLHGCRPSDDGELTSYDEYAYSFAYAIAGLPSVSVPAGGERGLPIGIQVVARAFRDDVALAAASHLESPLADGVPLPPALTG